MFRNASNGRIAQPSPVRRFSATVLRFAAACTLACALLAATPDAAHAQANEPTLFVGNNGNLIGSISSLRIHDNGSLSLTDMIVTGQRGSTSESCPGCNTYAISVTPDGQYLVAGHASSSSHPVAVSITRVNPDGTLTLVRLQQVPHSPLDVVWLNDNYFAVARANLSDANNQILVYRYNRETEAVTLVSFDNTGGFTTGLAVDREDQRLFAQRSSGGSAVRSYSYNDNGIITPIGTHLTGSTYPLGIGIDSEGLRLYGGGGISNGGDKIVGLRINPDGTMGSMGGSPFTSPGASPKQVVVSDDGDWAIVGHGTDATVRTFAINPTSGELTPTGHFFDVGLQGSLGNIATAKGLVFATDNTTAIDGIMGVYSFSIGANGELIQNGPIVDTDGIAPRAVAPWFPATCPADLNGDDVVDGGDLLLLLAAWGKCPGCAEDLNDDGIVDGADLLIMLSNWGPCPG